MTPGDWKNYDDTVRRRCEQLGVDGTRRALTEGKFGDRKERVARAWLEEIDNKSATADRETDRTIAKNAARSARTANIIATAALIVALAAILTQDGVWKAVARLVHVK